MATLHRATLNPTKAEVITEWIPSQPWGPQGTDPVTLVGAYRFDDPDGRVGLETHIVRAGTALLQVPLTYRDEPLEGAEDAFITQMEHSVLGDRWVYDGLRDPRFVVMLAAVALTGQGEALGMVQVDGRWIIVPSGVRIHGGGWTQDRVPVDEFELVSDEAGASVLRNEQFELTVFRRPEPGPRPTIGLTAHWDGSGGEAVLAEIRER
jgi:Maltokinase N-terminal cap domain